MLDFLYKEDITPGTVIETRDKEFYLFVYDEDKRPTFINQKGYSQSLDAFADNMFHLKHRSFDVMKAYKNSIFGTALGIEGVAKEENLIFERKEIDWEKVSVDTKVRISAGKNQYSNCYFAKYKNGQVFVFKGGGTSWSRIGQIFPVDKNYVQLIEDNPEYHKSASLSEKKEPQKEEFRDIEGFSNYKASNLGRIISKERKVGKRTLSEKTIAFHVDKRKKNNAPSVTLYSDEKKPICRAASWFIAKAFVPNPENKKYALLKDKSLPPTPDNIFWANTNIEEART